MEHSDQKTKILQFITEKANLEIFRAFLLQNDPNCSDIDANMGRELGTGATGKVFNFRGVLRSVPKTRKLAVKQINIPFVSVSISKRKKRIAAKFFGKSEEDFKEEKISLPYFLLSDCHTSYKRLDTGEEVEIPKNGVVCDSEYTEFIISVLVGENKRKGISINFFETYQFSICANLEKNIGSYFLFMEEMYASMKQLALAGHILYTYIQSLHAIATFQKYGKIVHGDCHYGNIFLERVEWNSQWRNTNLTDIDYYEYKIGEKSIYLQGPNCPFIVKVGDWDTAVKYDFPIIGASETLSGVGYKNPKPNWYCESYDVLTLTFSIYYGHKAQTPQLIKNILCWMFGKDFRNIDDIDSFIQKKITESIYPDGHPYFVDIKLLESKFSHVSPIAILTHQSLMDNFTTKPPQDTKIVVLGEI